MYSFMDSKTQENEESNHLLVGSKDFQEYSEIYWTQI